MMLFKLSLLAALAANTIADFTTPAAGDTDASSDLSKNPIYPFGSTVNVQWDSTLARISLILWQNDNDALETVLSNVSNSGSYKWKVNTSKNYQSQTASNGEVFFLSIFEPGQTEPDFSSRFFNITAPTTTSTSSSTTSATSTSKTSSTSTSSTSATATSTANAANGASSGSNQQATASPSSSNSVALGAGLGVGLGVPLLAGIAALIWFLRRRKSRSEVGVVAQTGYTGAGGAGAVPAGHKAATEGEAAAAGGAAGYYQPPEKGPLLQQPTGPAEMMDNSPQPMYEMEGTAYTGRAEEGRMMHEMPSSNA